MSAFQKKLEKLRIQIDRVDTQILRSLNKRFEVIQDVVELKRKYGKKIYDPKRERMLLAKLEEKNRKLKGGLSPRFMSRIYKSIIECSRKTQTKKLKQWARPARKTKKRKPKFFSP